MRSTWTLILFSCVALLQAGCKRTQPSQVATLPKNTNVLLITLDTTRADRMGFHGYALAATPTLDAMAARSTVFDDAHATVPLTLPSHATIHTGRFPREHGLRINGRAQLGDTHPTLARLFRDSGYGTAAFVSTFVLDGGYGLSRGFEVYDDKVSDLEPGADIQEAERRGDATTTQALAWLQAQGDRPFFCWIHYYDPHHPYAPPEPFRSQHPDPYDGEIAFMDAQIARVMKWLQSASLADRTLVVVAGDHGESFGEHGEWGHTTFVYETNLRVPLFFMHPQVVKAGHRVATTVSLVDVFPTIVDLIGFPKPRDLMGQSLIPSLSGGAIPERPAYAESENVHVVHTWAQQRTLMSGPWKYVSSTKPELFDRKSDRPEKRNLIDERRDVAIEMHQKLEQLYLEMVPGEAVRSHQSPETIRRLESLGYVSGMAKNTKDELLTEGLPDPKDMVDVIRDLEQVHDLFEKNRFGEAVPLLEKAALRSPESVDVLQRLGRAYMKSNRINEAIETLKKALHIDANYRAAIRTLADAFMHARRRPEAIEHYELSLSLFPDDPQTLFNVGTAYLDERRLDEAIARFQKAVAIKPDYGDALVNLGAALLQKGAFDDAEAALIKATTLPPTAPAAYHVLARVYGVRGQLDQAVEYLQKALELRPAFERAADELAGIFLRTGQTAKASAVLRKFLEAAPDNIPLSLTYAEILASSKLPAFRNGPESLRIAEKAVQQTDGKDFRALATLGLAQAETGDFEAAIRSAERAMDLVQAAGNTQLVALFREQITLYRAHQPFRNPGF